ncbi:threonine synthase [bacterium]|nr:threonine synthase [bacterium]MBU1153283.1 threonine synthase [bacterium]
MNLENYGVINRYREFLPVSENTPIVTLNEGNTPLIFASNLSQYLGSEIKLYLKYEGLNPTGSFKDRGMTVAVSKAKEEGAQIIICASTGNTSASAAAYAAKGRLRCVVLIPEGAIALGKLAQALIYGAQVLAVKGNFDEALSLVLEITKRYPITLVNSLNPYRLQGQKTAAFEICDFLKKAPDYHVIPVGNAGNITAYWMGYKEYKEKGRINNLPKMVGFQAAGAAPIVEKRVIKDPKTIATAIKIGNPASWKKAEEARDESKGIIDKVTDEEILLAYKLLANLEGIFVEPASAASIAGIIKKKQENYFPKEATIVAVLTGHGLKDPDCAITESKKITLVGANIEEIRNAIGLN